MEAQVRAPAAKTRLLAALAAACVLFLARGAADAAGNGTVAASAMVLSNSNCRFVPPGATAALDFGALDPLNPVNVTVTIAMQIRCGGPAGSATYLIVDDDGLHESGPGAQRMQHTVNPAAFLPYAFSYAPATATIPRNTVTPITITGTVLGVNYQDALVGSYADTVTLTIVP
ncbi:MAG TPA: spore coat protein U domain-containing protein [Candidatus Methanoperedens sp.]|nr:spore coat protein U domain-containing protein [Candidatus Methanoperedens sp.]